MINYTDKQILFIKELRKKKYSWDKITEEYNKKYGDIEKKTVNALRKIYARYIDIDFTDSVVINSIQNTETAKRRSSILAKENKLLVNYVSGKKSLLDEINELITSKKFKLLNIPKYKFDNKKRNMTIETLFSDLHTGKFTLTFNSDILKKRVEKYSSTIIGEINRYETLYNVEKIVIPMLGDLIENSYMHGVESLAGCEFQNPEQIRMTIDIIFNNFLLPISMTGRQIILPCVTGNHSRISFKETYINPGKNNLSWIIYKVLEMLCKQCKLNNITFIIPEGNYCTYEIYNDIILYEHGEKLNGFNQKTVESHIHERSRQIKKMIKFGRFGHFHEAMSYGRGRVIFNASFSGLDSYSEIKGYCSEPSQTINFYVEPINRPDSFYHSFIVYLG